MKNSKWVRAVVLLVAVMLALPVIACSQDREWAGRDRYMQPERIMDAVGVKPGMIIGEAGAGTGYFTFHLSKRIGETGHIYANDISTRSLNKLKQYAEDLKATNITTLVGEIDDPLFPVNNLEMVFFVIALHDFTEEDAFLDNLKKYLAPGARVVIIDFDPDERGGHDHFGSPSIRNVEELKVLFSRHGYSFVQSEDFLDKYLIAVFQL